MLVLLVRRLVGGEAGRQQKGRGEGRGKKGQGHGELHDKVAYHRCCCLCVCVHDVCKCRAGIWQGGNDEGKEEFAPNPLACISSAHIYTLCPPCSHTQHIKIKYK